MPKFKTVKRKKECEFCHKKFKGLKNHEKSCKERPVNTYAHIPYDRSVSLSPEGFAQMKFKEGYEAAKRDFNERREEIRLTTIRSVAEAMTSLAHFVDNMNGLMLSGRN